ncbi:MAG TPA: PH domain-containing protein [Ornithinibacter sp.]|nr:PH domain-containing protein [Ornithinibacter sp.]
MGEPDGWQRLHPLSPILRGGIVLLAVLGYAASQLFDRVLTSLGLGSLLPGGGIPDGGSPDDPTEALVAHPFVALLLVLAAIGVVAGANWLSWRFSRFRVAPHQVELRQGILFRQHRQVPFERVQAVELSRPLLARLLGLAQVVVQSAGGSDSHLRLAFLSLSRAEQLRDELLVRAGRSDEVALPAPDPADGSPADRSDHPGGPDATAVPARPGGPAGAGTPVLSVPNGRLFVATILHSSTIVLGVLAVAAVGGTGLGRFGPVVLVGVPALLPIAIGVGISRVKELLTHGNFRIADTGTGVRVQEGLTDLRTTTIPMHRIQALELVQPLWWRALGWWRIRVNVAGAQGGGDGDDSRETTLLPVGTLDDARLVLAVVAPRLAHELWQHAALGDGPEPGWRSVSRRTRALDPLSWRRNAWTVDPYAVILRSGRVTRRVVAVPHARVQSLGLSQGWLERRLRVASVQVVPAPGPVDPRLSHLEVEDAESFLAEVSDRARVARRAGHPEAPALAPDPPGLVDWTPHLQGSPDNERS